MKIPKIIKLFGEDYTIKKVAKAELICERCSDSSRAEIDSDTRIIQIAYDDPEMTEEELLLHELGHYFGRVITGQDNEAGANAFAHFVQTIIKQLGYK